MEPFESQLAQALLSEQRATRRWKNIRFFVWLFLWVAFFALLLLPPILSHSSNDTDTHGKPYVALLRLNGVIMPDTQFSARKMIPHLLDAFRDKKAKGIVLVINSPGGSPVQASLIHDKIIQLKNKYHKEVIVVGEDSLASGAYLVATAADKIFVNKDTVTGSIGVIMEGFGFENAIAKIGVTRRVFTAGDNKDRLDAFMAMKPADKEKIDHILDAVHDDFINDVKVGRGNKLSGDPKELFSGDFWTGTQAVQLGLADATATPWEAMQQTFGTMVYRDYTPRASVFESMVKDLTTEFHLPMRTQLQAVLR